MRVLGRDTVRASAASGVNRLLGKAKVEYRPFSSSKPEAAVDFASTAALRPRVGMQVPLLTSVQIATPVLLPVVDRPCVAHAQLQGFVVEFCSCMFNTA